jgi:hypothetical protein
LELKCSAREPIWICRPARHGGKSRARDGEGAARDGRGGPARSDAGACLENSNGPVRPVATRPDNRRRPARSGTTDPDAGRCRTSPDGRYGPGGLRRRTRPVGRKGFARPPKPDPPDRALGTRPGARDLDDRQSRTRPTGRNGSGRRSLPDPPGRAQRDRAPACGYGTRAGFLPAETRDREPAPQGFPPEASPKLLTKRGRELNILSIETPDRFPASPFPGRGAKGIPGPWLVPRPAAERSPAHTGGMPDGRRTARSPEEAAGPGAPSPAAPLSGAPDCDIPSFFFEAAPGGAASARRDPRAPGGKGSLTLGGPPEPKPRHPPGTSLGAIYSWLTRPGT